jgi:hypothetical protein
LIVENTRPVSWRPESGDVRVGAHRYWTRRKSASPRRCSRTQ